MKMESQVKAKLELKAIFRPADQRMSLSEAKDRAEACGNRIFDYGDNADKAILVCHEKGKMVAYAFIPELSPPNSTFEQCAAHMKAAGFEVRGEGMPDIDGNRTIMVWEKENV